MNQIYARHALLKFYPVRLATFKDWPLADPLPKELAEAGFYYNGYSTSATCFSCGVSFYNWNYPRMPALEKHRESRPWCGFILNQDISLTTAPENAGMEKDLPMQVFVPSSPIEISADDSNLIFGDSALQNPTLTFAINPIRNPTNITVPVTIYMRLPNQSAEYILDMRSTLISMRSERQRLETFKVGGWAMQLPSKEDLAKNGFFHLQLADFTQCAFCLMVVSVWSTCTDVSSFHRHENANCKFVKGENVGNIPIGEETIETEDDERLFCSICNEVEKCILFLPCKHCCTCETCGLDNTLRQCPICRRIIKRREKIYI
ncbi:uncharacterized protein B4U80_05490 [Leptotrombidium deliense]|uniref:RING-type domain-containing protein n=1 Tax=Leptotrombidium deliense TaxID=299467 RepID=A0A443SJW3_9ACAR|nr:uncharacterized protein B4U80_05490 [Leptotrombidium deliense]